MALHLLSTGVSFADFGSTGETGASMVNELMDDYEEGTYTPVFAAATVTALHGTLYTKIGNFVYQNCYCELGSGGSGNLLHTQSPFTCTTNGYAAGSIDYAAAHDNFTNPHVRSNSNASTVSFYKNQVTYLIGTDMDAGHVIWSLGYHTAT